MTTPKTALLARFETHLALKDSSPGFHLSNDDYAEIVDALRDRCGVPNVRLEARPADDSQEWTEIYPAQLEWVVRQGHQVRAIETPQPQCGVQSVDDDADIQSKLASIDRAVYRLREWARLEGPYTEIIKEAAIIGKRAEQLRALAGSVAQAAPTRQKMNHPQRPDEADYEYNDLQRRIETMGGPKVVVGILQQYAFAAPREGSYAGSLWAIAEWLNEHLSSSVSSAHSPCEAGK